MMNNNIVKEEYPINKINKNDFAYSKNPNQSVNSKNIKLANDDILNKSLKRKITSIVQKLVLLGIINFYWID